MRLRRIVRFRLQHTIVSREGNSGCILSAAGTLKLFTGQHYLEAENFKMHRQSV